MECFFCVAYRDILKRDDSARLLVGRILEVVQAVVVENEPASLPTLVSTALLPKPTFFVGVEEGVHEIVAVVLRDLERLRSDGFVQRFEQLSREVAAIVDAPVHRDELLYGGFVFD